MKKLTADWITNPTSQMICAILTDAGYQVYFVGGCVRNALLNASVCDLDLTTNAHPDVVMSLFKTANVKAIPTGIDHGTVTIIADGTPFEITTYRRDVETDGRRAVVAFADNIADDARRRDFTMNALYADPDGTIHDPLGGMNDLNARRVRFIENAGQRIREDYLRTLRFFRFHAWYGDPDGGIDPDALAGISANLDGLGTLSAERVGSEIKKLLSAPDPALSVASMRETGVLTAILPGANDRALAPLIHLESNITSSRDPIRRLAALGVGNVAETLRFSKAEHKQYQTLQTEIGSTTPPHALGYLHGFDAAQNIVLLRAAMFEIPLSDTAIKDAQFGSTQQFPVKAADFMPAFTGRALGDKLAALKSDWIDSRFSLTRSQLLNA